MIELANVTLPLASAEPFDHSLAAGEITVVLGANRSGKTDLCRLIAVLHMQPSGRLRWMARPWVRSIPVSDNRRTKK